MSDRPGFVTLRLTNPRMGEGDSRAPLVRAVQHRLRGYGIEQDGVYGPRTSWAVSVWQERVGSLNVMGAISPAELLVLFGHVKPPAEWIARRGDAARRTRARARQAELARLADIERPVGQLRIVARESWLPFSPSGVSRVVHAAGVPHVVHWFGPGRAAVGYDAGVAQCVGFGRYHRFTLGWADFAYNWAILRDGEDGRLCTVLEGRGRHVRGAHSGHSLANTYPGVLVLCGTDSPTPTDEQLATLAALREQETWGRRTGHLEWSPTSCPGPVLWPWVQAHR